MIGLSLNPVIGAFAAMKGGITALRRMVVVLSHGLHEGLRINATGLRQFRDTVPAFQIAVV